MPERRSGHEWRARRSFASSAAWKHAQRTVQMMTARPTIHVATCSRTAGSGESPASTDASSVISCMTYLSGAAASDGREAPIRWTKYGGSPRSVNGRALIHRNPWPRRIARMSSSSAAGRGVRFYGATAPRPRERSPAGCGELASPAGDNSPHPSPALPDRSGTSARFRLCATSVHLSLSPATSAGFHASGQPPGECWFPRNGAAVPIRRGEWAVFRGSRPGPVGRPRPARHGAGVRPRRRPAAPSAGA